jgi:hypothetical protein
MSALGGVEQLAHESGTRFDRISAARSNTEQRLSERCARFDERSFEEDTAVVLTGSWGRREVTSASDDDFMVLVLGSRRDGVHPTVEEAAEVLQAKASGREGIFSEQVWLDDLLQKIGRDEDTNANLTRRMLLLLESVAVSGEAFHAEARQRVLAGYLNESLKNHRPPRFLLNDLIRYWRTIAVDFESKMRDRKGNGWGVRNAKLRLSRKALFAGGLFPVLECYRFPASEMLGYLVDCMSMPPLDRIANAFIAHGSIDQGARSLLAYDAFLGILDDREQRLELHNLGADQSSESPVFRRVAELGHEFESGLLSVLFDNAEMQHWVREYLIF